MGNKAFFTNCVLCGDGKAINEMTENARQITLRTFREHLKKGEFDKLKNQLGYSKHQKQGLTIGQDWAIRFYKSKFKNRPCVYVDWSSIEYIFT